MIEQEDQMVHAAIEGELSTLSADISKPRICNDSFGPEVSDVKRHKIDDLIKFIEFKMDECDKIRTDSTLEELVTERFDAKYSAYAVVLNYIINEI